MNQLPERWADFFHQRTQERIQNHCHRQLQSMPRTGQHIHLQVASLLNLAGNDYLGLASDTALFADFLAQTPPEARLPSSSASQLLTGHSPAHQQLETQLSHLYQSQAALTFTTGYQMNSGLMAALADKNTLVLADKLIHASLIDGILLSGARLHRFHHNDTTHLAQLLERHHHQFTRTLIVTESLFSMDGDLAPLAEIVQLKQQYPNTAIYLDEAHAFGVRGEHGLGVAEETGHLKHIDFLVGTFGKAAASLGGFLICDPHTRDYLINHCRPLIFSTALPPLNTAWNTYIVQRLSQFHQQRQHLAQLSHRLIDAIHNHFGARACPSASQIVPLILGSATAAQHAAQMLQQAGYHAPVIRHPTVPTGTERLRFSLNAALTDTQIDTLIAILPQLKSQP